MKQVGIKHYIRNAVALMMQNINQEFVYFDALILVGENIIKIKAKYIIQTGKEIQWQRLTGGEVCYFKGHNNRFETKVKFFPVHAMKAYGKRRSISPLILKLGTNWR